jgi:hypothetical protein
MLYELASNKNIILAQIIGYNRYYLTLSRSLNATLHEQLLSLYSSLSDVTLNTMDDLIIWRWSSNDIFSTNSCYIWLNHGGMVDLQFQSI